MAWQVVNCEVIFTFTDDANMAATTQVNVPLPPVLNYTNALAFAATLASAFRAISTAKLDKFLIRLSSFDGASNPPAADVDLSSVAAFIYAAADTTLWVQTIPSARASSYETAGAFAGIEVDREVSAIADVISIMAEAAGGLIPVSPFTLSPISELREAYRQVRP